MLLEGLHLPLSTPFYPDGRLNLRKLEHNVYRYSKTPVAGLVAPGEATLVSDEETRLVLRSVVEVAGAEKTLIARDSRDSVAGTLNLAEYAAGLGYDALLVKASGAARGTKELLSYFQVVADRSALPILICNEARSPLPVEVVVEVAGHPGVVGLVDGGGEGRVRSIMGRVAGVRREVAVTAVFAAVTGRMQASAGGLISAGTLTGTVAVAPAGAALKTRTKVVGFQILMGGTGGMLEGFRSGAVGAVPGFAACAPQACYEVLAAWKDGDEGLAEEKQARLQEVGRRIEEELGVPGIKYGCDLNGYFGGMARLPLLPLTGAERGEIEELMRGLRN